MSFAKVMSYDESQKKYVGFLWNLSNYGTIKLYYVIAVAFDIF